MFPLTYILLYSIAFFSITFSNHQVTTNLHIKTCTTWLRASQLECNSNDYANSLVTQHAITPQHRLQNYISPKHIILYSSRFSCSLTHDYTDNRVTLSLQEHSSRIPPLIVSNLSRTLSQKPFLSLIFMFYLFQMHQKIIS